MKRIWGKYGEISVDECMVFNGNFNELDFDSIMLVLFLYMILSKIYIGLISIHGIILYPNSITLVWFLAIVWFVYMILRKMYMSDSFVSEWRYTVLTELL